MELEILLQSTQMVKVVNPGSREWEGQEFVSNDSCYLLYVIKQGFDPTHSIYHLHFPILDPAILSILGPVSDPNIVSVHP